MWSYVCMYSVKRGESESEKPDKDFYLRFECVADFFFILHIVHVMHKVNNSSRKVSYIFAVSVFPAFAVCVCLVLVF